MVHRDIKSDNIMTHIDENNNEIIKIIDFGFSRILDEFGNASTILGTPNNMAPEIFFCEYGI